MLIHLSVLDALVSESSRIAFLLALIEAERSPARLDHREQNAIDRFVSHALHDSVDPLTVARAGAIKRLPAPFAPISN